MGRQEPILDAASQLGSGRSCRDDDKTIARGESITLTGERDDDFAKGLEVGNAN